MDGAFSALPEFSKNRHQALSCLRLERALELAVICSTFHDVNISISKTRSRGHMLGCFRRWRLWLHDRMVFFRDRKTTPAFSTCVRSFGLVAEVYKLLLVRYVRCSIHPPLSSSTLKITYERNDICFSLFPKRSIIQKHIWLGETEYSKQHYSAVMTHRL
jgi:hypothetical protein